jgi:hypothetical protein
MGMWIIGGAVIIAIVLLPKILGQIIGSQQLEYKNGESKHDETEG